MQFMVIYAKGCQGVQSSRSKANQLGRVFSFALHATNATISKLTPVPVIPDSLVPMAGNSVVASLLIFTSTQKISLSRLRPVLDNRFSLHSHPPISPCPQRTYPALPTKNRNYSRSLPTTTSMPRLIIIRNYTKGR